MWHYIKLHQDWLFSHPIQFTTRKQSYSLVLNLANGELLQEQEHFPVKVLNLYMKHRVLISAPMIN
jgi:hypothetical protein